MKRITLLIAAVLVACVGLVNVAGAQEGEGFPFPPPAPAAEPVPTNPTHKVLESGKVIVAVGNEKDFKVTIGAPVPIRVVISVDPAVKVNTEVIERKISPPGESDLEYTDTPVKKYVYMKDGKQVYEFELEVRTWRTVQYVVFNTRFMYAVSTLVDGKSPDWREVTTPDFVLERSNTATDISKNLKMGDTKTKTATRSIVAEPLRVGGIALILPLFAWLVYRAFRRVRPKRTYTRSERAWLILGPVVNDARARGMSQKHIRKIASSVREYLGVESVLTEHLSPALEEFFAVHERKLDMIALAVNVIVKLDDILYRENVKVDAAEQEKLIAEIEQLIPRG